MDEDLVKEVLLRHLELKGKQPRRRARQASGPDVLVEGTAIEVKGSKIVERSLLSQLAVYLHDYAFVELAIPVQAFSFSLLHKLRTLELLSQKGGLTRTIRLYVVASNGANQFAVLEADSVLQLSIKSDQATYQLSKEHSDGDTSVKAEVAFNIESRVREHLQLLVRAEGVRVVLDSLAGV
jgi:hypothetical protein